MEKTDQVTAVSRSRTKHTVLKGLKKTLRKKFTIVTTGGYGAIADQGVECLRSGEGGVTDAGETYQGNVGRVKGRVMGVSDGSLAFVFYGFMVSILGTGSYGMYCTVGRGSYCTGTV